MDPQKSARLRRAAEGSAQFAVERAARERELRIQRAEERKKEFQKKQKEDEERSERLKRAQSQAQACRDHLARKAQASEGNTRNFLRQSRPEEPLDSVPSNAVSFKTEILKETKGEATKKFRYSEKTVLLKVSHNLATIRDIFSVAPAIDNLGDKIIRPHIQGLKTTDVVSVTICHDDLHREHFGDIYMNFKAGRYDKENFGNHIFQVCQSNSSFLLDGVLRVQIAIFKDTSGSGGHASNNPRTLEEKLKKMTSIVSVNRDDHMCGYRAFVLGRYAIDHRNDADFAKNWDAYCRERVRFIRDQLTDLKSDGIDISVPLDNEGFRKIDETYSDYQLVVFAVSDGEQLKNARLAFKANGDYERKRIVLLLVEGKEGYGHYYLVHTGKEHLLFDHKQFCVSCETSYKHPFTHKCKDTCTQCFSSPSCAECSTQICECCGRGFFGDNCFARHIQNNVCQTITICKSCGIQHNSKTSTHRCSGKPCFKCGEAITTGKHYCWMKPIDKEKLKKEDAKNKIIVVFDIESRIVTESKDVSRHEAILLVSRTICNKCYKHENVHKKDELGNFLPMKEEDCEVCGKYEHIFTKKRCVQEFMTYILGEIAVRADKPKRPLKVKIYAHNFKAYDGRFILREIYARKFDNDLTIIQTGTKLLKVSIGNVDFLDSISLLQQPLAALPKSFGFSDRVVKGHFPYLLDMETADQLWDYKGPLPPIHLYGIDFMKEGAAKDLKAWYEEQDKEVAFEYSKECLKYCSADCEVLLIGLMSFGISGEALTGVSPLTRSFTLGQYALEFFRTTVGRGVVGLTPTLGYESKRRCSKTADIWLDYCRDSGKTIIPEVKIGRYFVDGYDEINKTIYEFYGCLWHGCQRCFPRGGAFPLAGKSNADKQETLQDRWLRTNERREWFLSKGYKLIEMWYCEFEMRRGTEKDFDDFVRERYAVLDQIEIDAVGKIKDAFFGGSTDNIQFIRKVLAWQKIIYMDFMSLYPSVMKNCAYPKGHPDIITENILNLENYRGFAEVTVSAPKRCAHAVLPVTIDSKLMFPLCITCAKTRNQGTCKHKKAERYLRGTWTTAELKLAVEVGYKIKKIHKVFHYDVWEEGLFKDYINLWLKVKVEASGFPLNSDGTEMNDQEKQAYVDRFEAQEGIKLDIKAIKKNPNLRSIAKLMLNCLWVSCLENTQIGSYFNSFSCYRESLHKELIFHKPKLWTITRSFGISFQMIPKSSLAIVVSPKTK